MLPYWYNKYKNLIEKSIFLYLDNYFIGKYDSNLSIFKEACYYSVKGGKRIRSILALEFYLISSNKTFLDINIGDNILKLCIALELIHAYSLVHDDLPCMDNDEYRRGELTVWKKYGEDYGFLVGDLLNTLCFEVLSEINSDKTLEIIKILSKNSGFYGMIGGQVLDLFYEKNLNNLSKEKLENIHNNKTGALIEASVLSGLLLGGEKDVSKYSLFAKNIGLAFQVKDDLLDVEGNLEETGKSVGGEQKGFVYFMGIEKTRKYLDKLLFDSKEIIKNTNSEKLGFLIDYIGNRNK